MPVRDMVFQKEKECGVIRISRTKSSRVRGNVRDQAV
jgi:hypothetical protein